jgi:hypothetical protein
LKSQLGPKKGQHARTGPPKVKLSPEPPEEYKLLNMFPRPLGSLKGPRRVPTMVNANGFPFLRWKKPQPSRVSALISRLIKDKQARLDGAEEVENYYRPLAEWEDEWDSLVSGAKKTGRNYSESFTATIEEVKQELQAELRLSQKTQTKWINQMESIIAEEKRFKAIEEAEEMVKSQEGILNGLWRSARRWWTKMYISP